MAKSILISSLILLCASIIETSILSNLAFLMIVPDLVLMCSIYFSLLNGRTVGVSTGFISGIILDFVTGMPFGFNAVFRTIIGYVFGFFSENLIVSGFIMPMFAVGVGTFLKHLLMFLINLMYPNIDLNIAGIISTDFLFELIENIILAPVVFKFLGVFKKTLSTRSVKDKIDNV